MKRYLLVMAAALITLSACSHQLQAESTLPVPRTPALETIHGFVVPLNFADNGASVPLDWLKYDQMLLDINLGMQARFSLNERFPKVWRLHDYLYSDRGIQAYPDLTRAQVDAVMWVQLVTLGCDSKEASLIHTAVRMKGMNNTARGETPKKQPSLSDLLQPAPAKKIGYGDSDLGMNPSQPVHPTGYGYDNRRTKKLAPPNVNMNPSQPVRPIGNSYNYNLSKPPSPPNVNMNPSQPVRPIGYGSDNNQAKQPALPQQAAPDKTSPVNNSGKPAPVTATGYGYDNKELVAARKDAAAAKAAADKLERPLAPKGVTMKVGINQGTLQRVEAPTTLLDAIRGVK